MEKKNITLLVKRGFQLNISELMTMRFHDQECIFRAKCGFPHLTRDVPRCECSCHIAWENLPIRVKGMLYPLKVTE